MSCVSYVSCILTGKDPAHGDKAEGKEKLLIFGESVLVNVAQRTMRDVLGMENLSVRADPQIHFKYCLTACDESEIFVLTREFASYCLVIHEC